MSGSEQTRPAPIPKRPAEATPLQTDVAVRKTVEAKDIELQGAEPSYFQIKKYDIERGRAFTPQGREQPLVTGEDGRAVLEVIFAAYESAGTGRKVALPFKSDAKRPRSSSRRTARPMRVSTMPAVSAPLSPTRRASGTAARPRGLLSPF